jgi:hypothetical protein
MLVWSVVVCAEDFDKDFGRTMRDKFFLAMAEMPVV